MRGVVQNQNNRFVLAESANRIPCKSILQGICSLASSQTSSVHREKVRTKTSHNLSLARYDLHARTRKSTQHAPILQATPRSLFVNKRKENAPIRLVHIPAPLLWAEAKATLAQPIDPCSSISAPWLAIFRGHHYYYSRMGELVHGSSTRCGQWARNTGHPYSCLVQSKVPHRISHSIMETS